MRRAALAVAFAFLLLVAAFALLITLDTAGGAQASYALHASSGAPSPVGTAPGPVGTAPGPVVTVPPPPPSYPPPPPVVSVQPTIRPTAVPTVRAKPTREPAPICNPGNPAYRPLCKYIDGTRWNFDR
jgi:hypothetical protein